MPPFWGSWREVARPPPPAARSPSPSPSRGAEGAVQTRTRRLAPSAVRVGSATTLAAAPKVGARGLFSMWQRMFVNYTYFMRLCSRADGETRRATSRKNWRRPPFARRRCRDGHHVRHLPLPSRGPSSGTLRPRLLQRLPTTPPDDALGRGKVPSVPCLARPTATVFQIGHRRMRRQRLDARFRARHQP